MNETGNTMKTESRSQWITVFPAATAKAMAELKIRLQRDYEESYPDLREIIHLVIEDEERKAWELTSFPHLVLPDLVAAHVATLGLKPALPQHAHLRAPRRTAELILAAAG
jgi:hypothetical protein